MKTYTEQFLADFGTCVTTINPGDNYSFKVKNVEFNKNQSAIVTANVAVQYDVNNEIQMNVLRDGISITNGPQAMFNTVIQASIPVSLPINVTYTFEMVDNTIGQDNKMSNYEFIIYSAGNIPNVIVITQANFTVLPINNDYVSVNQEHPPNGTIVESLAPNASTTILIPVPKIKVDCCNCDKKYNRILDVNVNIIKTGPVKLEVDILNPNDQSLTNGPQIIFESNTASTTTVTAEFNLNLSTVDLNTAVDSSGFYKLILTNVPVLLGSTFTIDIDFYSFFAYIVDENDLKVVSLFPKQTVDAPAIILPSGAKRTVDVKFDHSNNKKYDIKTLMFMGNLVGRSIEGLELFNNILVNVNKKNNSVTDGLYNLMTLPSSVSYNVNSIVTDRNEKNDSYSVELYNVGILDVDVDFYNLVTLSSNGRFNSTTYNNQINQ